MPQNVFLVYINICCFINIAILFLLI